jgi:hypothetical protein
MAVPKAIRSNSLAQPARRRSNSQPKKLQLKDRQLRDPHLKAEIFDTLRQLNRGYGIALAALVRLGGTNKDGFQRPQIFSARCLHDYRSRTETLRALANRDLLRLLAGHEELDAARFGHIKHNRRL